MTALIRQSAPLLAALTIPIAAALPALDAQERFRRGDANGDDEVNLTDGVFTLNFLFLGGGAPGCLDAADHDDSGSLEVTTAVYLFNFLFLGGPPLPSPGSRECGADPTADGLSCLDYPGCEAVDTCGGCPPDQFCSTPPGACDDAGFCRDVPEVCPPLSEPVCGCDGVTYDNQCVAAQAGVGIAFEGPCIPDGGCRDDEACGPDAYCKKLEGDCDGPGECTQIVPQPCPEVFDPVCGCDGVTYDNECFAEQAGASIAARGACAAGPCDTNEDCPGDFYCARAVGDCDSPASDRSCAERPTACPRNFDPVCGCDGVTYDNECLARANGVNVARLGPCECPDLRGRWVLVATSDESDCDGCPAQPALALLEVDEQDDCAFRGALGCGDCEGELTESSFTFTCRENCEPQCPDEPCETAMGSGMVDPRASRFDAEMTWTASGGNVDCAGTRTVAGLRVVDPAADFSGAWRWDVETSACSAELPAFLDVDFTIDGERLTADSLLGTAAGFVSGDRVLLHFEERDAGGGLRFAFLLDARGDNLRLDGEIRWVGRTETCCREESPVTLTRMR